MRAELRGYSNLNRMQKQLLCKLGIFENMKAEQDSKIVHYCKSIHTLERVTSRWRHN